MSPDLEPAGEDEHVVRVKAVLGQYPFLAPFARALAKMPITSEQDVIEAATEIAQGFAVDDPELRATMAARDPDFGQKYKFLLTAGLLANPSIPAHLKLDINAIVFGDMVAGEAVKTS